MSFPYTSHEGPASERSAVSPVADLATLLAVYPGQLPLSDPDCLGVIAAADTAVAQAAMKANLGAMLGNEMD